MLIHTFETSFTVSSNVFFDIQNQLKMKNYKWDGRNEDRMVFYGLSKYGILIIFRRIRKPKFTSYRIMYVISAYRVFEPYRYVGLFDSRGYAELEERVDSLLYNLCPKLPPLRKCTPSRIDFCINAYLENQHQVKEYINLAKKCNIPKSMEESFLYDDKKHKMRSKKDMTIRSSEYIEISIYNKYAQMKDSAKNANSFPDMNDAKNIVRIEIRCMRNKLEHIAKKFGLQENSLLSYMRHADEIGKYLYKFYLKKMFCQGQFYTLAEAKKRIAMSGFSDETIAEMTEFAEYVNRERNLNEIVNVYTDNEGKKATKRILWLFDEIDTNPLTIPKSMAKIFGKEGVPHPLKLFKENCNIK